MNGNSILPETVEVHLAKGIVSDTTAETTTSVIDMVGTNPADEITFAVALGDVDAAAVLTFAVKQNSADSISSPTPTAVPILRTSAGVITAGNLVVTEDSDNLDDKLILITVAKNQITERYVFLSITATVESYEVNTILAIKSRSRKLPVTQPAAVFAVASGAS